MTIPHTLSTPRALVALTASAGLSAWLSASPPAEYELTFSDEFSQPLDSAVWQVDPTRPNLEVVNGTLQLVTESLSGGGFRTGKLATTKFRQRFGYYEARYQIGGDSGLNNAFWLNTPVPYAVQGNIYDRFEIDIQEAHFPNQLSMTAHDWAPTHQPFGGKKVVVPENLHTSYNTYALEWAHDNTLRYYFNGVLQHTYSGSTVRNAANTIPLEVLLSTLVTSFAGPEGPNLDGTRMIVDYVRVYDRPGFLGSISGNWGTESNWGSGLYARINDAAVFNRPVANTAITIAGVSKEAREVYFDHPELPSFTFTPRSDSPGAILRLGSGGAGAITLNYNVPSAQIFDLPIVAARRLTLGNFSSKPGALLDIRGPIRADTAGEALLFFNDGPVIARAPIESSIGPVDKYGNGEATLEVANAHTGITRVARGTLVVATDGGLGSVAAGTETGSGGTLALAGVTYTGLEALSLAGAGADGSAGALEARGAGASSFAGPINLTASASLGARDKDNSLSLTGSIGASGATRTLTITGDGLTVLSGEISGVGNLYVSGAGVARISHPSSSYGSGASVYVTSGTLLIPADAPNNGPGPLGASSFRVRLGSTFSQPGDDAALLTEGAVTIGRALQIEPNNLPGVSKIGGSTPHSSVFAGGVFLGRELTVEAVEGGEVLIQGAMVDFNTAGSVRKTGPGLVRFSGTNTYTGTTTVEQGVLRINEAASLPANTTLIVNEGGAFDLNGLVRTIAGFTLNGGELIDSAQSGSTVLSLATDQSYDLRSGRVFTRLGGGTNGVIKTTPGVATLAAENTYQGPTVIEAGTLLVDGSTNAQSAVSVNGGWLGGRGTVGGAVSVGAGGGLTFTLASAPVGHQPLLISGGLSITNGARVALTLLDGVEPGTYTLANAASGVSGALPVLDLPTGWSGELEAVGGALQVTLGQPEDSPITGWRVAYFGSAEPTGMAADDADPDGDGVPNLLEYALGGNPMGTNPAVLPQPTMSGNRLSMVVPRVADRNLLYIVKASGALTAESWTPIWSSTGDENAEGAVTVEDTVTLDDSPRRFMRLEVEYAD